MSREISVYSGTVRIGRLCVRRRDKDGASRVEAFTSDDVVSLGVYPDVRAAFAAVSVAARPDKSSPTKRAVDLKAPGTPKSKGVGKPAA